MTPTAIAEVVAGDAGDTQPTHLCVHRLTVRGSPIAPLLIEAEVSAAASDSLAAMSVGLQQEVGRGVDGLVVSLLTS